MSGLSQKEMAKLIGMTQTGYSKYETGTNDIPTHVLVKLAIMYDVSTDYLLGVTDIMRGHDRKHAIMLHEYRIRFLKAVREKRKKLNMGDLEVDDREKK